MLPGYMLLLVPVDSGIEFGMEKTLPVNGVANRYGKWIDTLPSASSVP
jgi:hypothetical protein